MCDDKLLFIDVVVGWLGFVYDLRVFCNFVLWNISVYKFFGDIYLLGDGGYLLLRCSKNI